MTTQMLLGASSYMNAARAVLDGVLATQMEAIGRAADAVVQAIKADGLIYLFGTGHSHMLSEEGHHRAGGLAPLCPILASSLMLHESSRVCSQLERIPGIGRAVLARYRLTPNDVLIVFSNSGVNALPVEVAMVGKEIGSTVIAVVSVEYSRQASPGASGKRLLDVADIIIDNRAPPGDALVEIPGSGGLRAGPISTVVGAYILNAIVTEVAWRLADAGDRPPVYASANMPRAEEQNAPLRRRYQPRIPAYVREGELTRRKAVGIDLGGTKVAAGLVDEAGEVLHVEVIETRPQDGVDAVMSRVAGCIQGLVSDAGERPEGIGLAVAGMVDSRRGIVVRSSNLKWVDIPVASWLGSHLPEPWAKRILVDKDTNAGALGEFLYGAGQGSSHLIYVTIGTGVGAGMVLSGSIYHGAQHGAGELGHLVLDPQGPVCGCGKTGCLEALASGPAIARECLQALRGGTPSLLASRDPGRLTARDVVECALEGDPLARSVLAVAGTRVGIALAYCTDLLNPDAIVMGGGVAVGAGEVLLSPIRETIAQRALRANASAVRVVPAGLGEKSGVIGAAALVWAAHRL